MLKKGPVKVLHVVYAMNVGGIETWLMTIYRKLDKDKIQFDFLVSTKQDAYFDAEIRKLGGNIIYAGSLKAIFTTYNTVSSLLKNGCYSAVHCHNVENSMPVLAGAFVHQVKTRIFHSHNDFNEGLLHLSSFQKIYLKLSRLLSIKLSNRYLAVSKLAGESLFNKKNYKLVSLGINFDDFNPKIDRKVSKSDFGLSEKDLVIGHVGRFDIQKNHDFLIEIAREVIILNPRSKFLLVGSGVLEGELKNKIKSMKLDNNFIFAGLRNDVPQVMSSVMDAFLFPSLFEGLGLVLVEAQAAGLPITYSNVIPKEAIINIDLAQKVDLTKPAKEWAILLLKNHEINRGYDKGKAYHKALISAFNINDTMTLLEELWQGKK